MICPHCVQAGQLLQHGHLKLARIPHEKCKGGTWCDCQHLVDPGAINPKFRKLEEDQ